MRDHTSLLAWRRAREVSAGSFRLAATHWSAAAGPALHQLRRAALSAQLNIAEGYAGGSRGIFRRHLRIAYGSAVEAGDVLDLLADLQLCPAEDLTALREENRRSQQLILALLHKLVNS